MYAKITIMLYNSHDMVKGRLEKNNIMDGLQIGFCSRHNLYTLGSLMP